MKVANPLRKRRSPIRWGHPVTMVLLTVVLLTFTLLVITPFIWMILMSVRTTSEIFANPYGLPTVVRWQNYVELMVNPQIRFYRYFYNSTFVTFFALLLTTILATMGGYAFGRSRYNFKFRWVLFTLLLFALMLPEQAKYIPQFTLMAQYGLLNTKWSLVLLYTATALPVSTYLMATYFSQLPNELEDAARIDGCNDWRIFWQVMLPLARPAVATILLINALYFWNELLLAVTMVTHPDRRTLPVAMMNFVGEQGSNYAMAAASLVVAMAPVMVLFIILSERFIEGLTAGALKG